MDQSSWIGIPLNHRSSFINTCRISGYTQGRYVYRSGHTQDIMYMGWHPVEKTDNNSGR